MTMVYVTDHAALEQALVNWAKTYADVLNVRWANQIARRPALPYILLQHITDGVIEGQDAEHQEFNATTGRIERVTYGDRRQTVQVTIYTEEETSVGQMNARNRMNMLLASLRSHVVKDLLHSVGMSFTQTLSGIRMLDEQLGERWERRAQVDLEFGYLSVLTDKPTTNDSQNWVEHVSPITKAASTLITQE